MLPTVDAPLGARVRQALVSRGADVRTGTTVAAIEQAADGLRVVDEHGDACEGRLVVGCVGVQPASGLAAAAGAQLGVRGAIEVDRGMATGLPATWAAGDCAETHHRLLDRPAYLPLGTTAHKQDASRARTRSGPAALRRVAGTQVVKVFELVAARTGLRDEDAREAGLSPLTTVPRSMITTPTFRVRGRSTSA